MFSWRSRSCFDSSHRGCSVDTITGIDVRSCRPISSWAGHYPHSSDVVRYANSTPYDCLLQYCLNGLHSMFRFAITLSVTWTHMMHTAACYRRQHSLGSHVLQIWTSAAESRMAMSFLPTWLSLRSCWRNLPLANR